ncbi:hypothetical protein MESS2_1360008 [Mesorhizobium metallidurans STM 2683]|uniref:Uncharacterized protein n=1 Tax=Mesorhizobium metallidurans STM 2683 TaxID=1297569 RepID=M5EKM5_9HYPH|nr:hypothetical protein MESS2_1360008 [Mesorhizobium metallidurans STM 2683]
MPASASCEGNSRNVCSGFRPELRKITLGAGQRLYKKLNRSLALFAILVPRLSSHSALGCC